MLLKSLQVSLSSSLFTALLLAAPATAQGNSELYVDDSAPLGGDGTSWATAYTYLQDAVLTAAPNATIYIAGGTYRPDLSENWGGQITLGDRSLSIQIAHNLELLGAHAGAYVGATNPDARDTLAYPSIITGDLAQNDPVNPGIYTPPASPGANPLLVENSAHVVRIDENALGVLNGLVIERGIAWQDTQLPGWVGGGILVASQGASMLLADSIVRWNYAEQAGGGVFSIGQALVFDQVVFLNNRSKEGGAIATGFNQDGPLTSVDTIISRCVFDENYAGPDRGRGGAVSFSYNYVVVMNNLFRLNISQGNASAEGGAIWMAKDVRVDANNNTFYKNRLIAAEGAAGSVIYIQGGGGVGGINLEFANNICWEGIPADKQLAYNGAFIGNFGHNDIQVLAPNLPPGVLSPGDDFEADPQFTDALCHIPSNSPCVDRGTNQGVNPFTLSFGSSDLDENLRIMDVSTSAAAGDGGGIGWGSAAQPNVRPIVDVGAYEQFDDCNNNRVPDVTDIQTGFSTDCNDNGKPDECEDLDDCNDNDIPDVCEDLDDCNDNDVPDVCEDLEDCNDNDIPDI